MPANPNINRECEDCGGLGYYYSDNGPAPVKIECPYCEGQGGWEVEPDDTDGEPPLTLDEQHAAAWQQHQDLHRR